MIDFGGLFGVLKPQLGTAYMLSVRGWTAVKRDGNMPPVKCGSCADVQCKHNVEYAYRPRMDASIK